MGKLFLLLFGLAVVAVVIDAAPRNKLSKRQVFAAKKWVKRNQPSFDRETFVEFLQQLTAEDIEKMSDEDKLGLLFLIYLFDVQPEELDKRSANGVFKRSLLGPKKSPKRSFGKRDLSTMSREEVVEYLKTLTLESVSAMSDEEQDEIDDVTRKYGIKNNEWLFSN